MAPSDHASYQSLYPFRSRWFDSPQGRMHYLDEAPADLAAEAPTLLFVHGNPTWSFHWRRLISSFRGRWRCIAMDHVGCGLSDVATRPLSLADHATNLRALIDHLGLSHVTLIAQDWGGAIGLTALDGQPDRIDRLVLFNTGAFPPWFIPWRIRVCRIPVLGRLAVQGLNLFTRAALRMTLARRRRLDRQVRAGYLATTDSWARRAAVYQFVRDIPLSPRHASWQTLCDTEASLSQLARHPILLVWGMRDWCFTPACLERFYEHWPRAEVVELADVGHWVVEDAPEDAVRLVSSFLDRDSPPPRVDSRVSESDVTADFDAP